MVQYTTTILKFGEQGEKTGWTYIEISADVAQQLKRGFKKSFRVKGKLDEHSIKGIALLPMGKGDFIMPLNSGMRKAIGKRHGAMLHIQLQEDKTPFQFNENLMTCLNDEPDALKFFKQLPGSHQRYFSKWIESVKTDDTIAKRIAQTVIAMLKKQNFAEMIRSLKK